MADVSVVGAGPNGLAAAVVMARAGLSVEVLEAADTIGGGSRTKELIEPGHLHDVCSAIHPMALASPFFRDFGLERRIRLIVPELSYANPLSGGRAGLAWRSLDRTVEGLGRDGGAYRSLMGPLARHSEAITDLLMGSLLQAPPKALRDPAAALRFGLSVLEQGSPAWNQRFRGEEAPAMLTGVAAHPVGRLPSLSSSGAGLMLSLLAHTVGWPVPEGGSQAIVEAMADDVRAHGGVIRTSSPVTSLDEVRGSRAVFLDLSPSGLLELAEEGLPHRYRRALEAFRYGNGACKVDFILSEPVPWANPEVGGASTVHLGGSRSETATAERQVAGGWHPDVPYVLAAQPTAFDPSRAPAGRHILWAYCHVPAGSNIDMTGTIIRRIEDFAPGFRDTIIASKAMSAADLQQYNANYVGGDFGGGAISLLQMLRRPVASPTPWRTPLPGVYLCSSSTPPGPGVHGMGGYNAALSALRHEFGVPVPSLAP